MIEPVTNKFARGMLAFDLDGPLLVLSLENDFLGLRLLTSLRPNFLLVFEIVELQVGIFRPVFPNF